MRSILVTLWVCTLLAPVHAFAGEDQKFIDEGTRFVRHLINGKYEAAVGMFDTTMNRVVPADKLKEMWEELAATNGPFKGIEDSPPTLTPYGRYRIVFVPCEWANARFRLKLVFNAGKEIAGLFFVEPAGKGAGEKPAYLRSKEIVEHEVTVGSGQWELPGTLALPKSGKVRAGVVLVHGSGPNDRDETLGHNKPFRDLAWGLGAKGIATLRYDKRTFVHGAKMGGAQVTVQDEVIDDALLALTLLRGRAELKGAPVFLLGHSLGAMLAPEIGRSDGKVAGVILLAGPARPSDEVVIEQFKYLTTINPTAKARTQLKEVATAIERLRKQELKSPYKVMGVDVNYWYDLLERDAETALEYAAKLTCRVLVVQGGRDYQATVEDFELWKSALAGHRDATFRLFDDLNHLFAIGEGKATPTEYTADEKFVDPRVIELIARWCGES